MVVPSNPLAPPAPAPGAPPSAPLLPPGARALTPPLFDPFDPVIPVALPVEGALSPVRTQPVAPVQAFALADCPERPMVVVPSAMVVCRSCHQSFPRDERRRGTAQYYRCSKCTSTEAMMIGLMYSCVVG